MTAQKLSSREAGLTSRLADPLLNEQVVNLLKCLLQLMSWCALVLFRAASRAGPLYCP